MPLRAESLTSSTSRATTSLMRVPGVEGDEGQGLIPGRLAGLDGTEVADLDGLDALRPPPGGLEVVAAHLAARPR